LWSAKGNKNGHIPSDKIEYALLKMMITAYIEIRFYERTKLFEIHDFPG